MVDSEKRDHVTQTLETGGDYCYASEKRIFLLTIYSLPKTAKYSILEKYQIALTLADKNLFKKGVSPYQDVYLLIQVRNAITHYEPEWVTTESEFPEKITEQALEKKLKHKFGLNPFASDCHFLS
ncbi:hypothetical protein [Paenibacillus xylanexedens]|uniref:hypothetical protein n=1 Tax=Paenibacillus xylanexedens TaxID=528191 RepID=UPI001C931504|nr:hypothetical protein [Paenibacillus xylanexedens]